MALVSCLPGFASKRQRQWSVQKVSGRPCGPHLHAPVGDELEREGAVLRRLHGRGEGVDVRGRVHEHVDADEGLLGGRRADIGGTGMAASVS
jgi:hypothetical protein